VPMLLDELKNIVGRHGWTTDPVDLEPHLTEWRGVVKGRTPILVAPSTTAQVADVLRACAGAGIGVVPQGGNTGLCGGAIPDETGDQVLLSMSRMNVIRSLDPEDFSIVAEAGCVLATIQEAAVNANRFFALSLSAEGSCQIGGNLSTDAGGMNVLRYGTARDQVLGLEVVLADGTIWNGLRSLRKDTAGYDLKQLFLGSEGTLGVITAATLKLYPDPGDITTALLAHDTAQQAVELLTFLRERIGDRILAFELISERAIQFVERHIPGAALPLDDRRSWYVLLDSAIESRRDELESALAEAIERGIAHDAIIAKNTSEAESLWRMRHSVSEAQRFEGASLKHDVAVPIGRIDEFLTRGQALVKSSMRDARLVAFGHVGDGNVHFNVSQPEHGDAGVFRARGEALTDGIYGLVTELGGTISAEHGIGTLKKSALARYRDPVELQLMRTLKIALDPANILNPGKVI